MNNDIFKDYTTKIHGKNFTINNEIQDINSVDFNNLIILLNYCFHNKNDFFINSFNGNLISLIKKFYNQFKTNILSEACIDIFENIRKDQLKIIRYIILQYLFNFKSLESNDIKLNPKFKNIDLDKLCFSVTETSMNKVIVFIDNYLYSNFDTMLAGCRKTISKNTSNELDSEKTETVI